MSAEENLGRYDAGDDEAAIRKYVIDELIVGVERNSKKLEDKQEALRIAFILWCSRYWH